MAQFPVPRHITACIGSGLRSARGVRPAEEDEEEEEEDELADDGAFEEQDPYGFAFGNTEGPIADMNNSMDSLDNLLDNESTTDVQETLDTIDGFIAEYNVSLPALNEVSSDERAPEIAELRSRFLRALVRLNALKRRILSITRQNRGAEEPPAKRKKGGRRPR